MTMIARTPAERREERKRDEEAIVLDWLYRNGFGESNPASVVKDSLPREFWPESARYDQAARNLGSARPEWPVSGSHLCGLAVFRRDQAVYLVDDVDGKREGISTYDGWSVTWSDGDGENIQKAEGLDYSTAIAVAWSWIKRMPAETKEESA